MSPLRRLSLNRLRLLAECPLRNRLAESLAAGAAAAGAGDLVRGRQVRRRPQLSRRHYPRVNRPARNPTVGKRRARRCQPLILRRSSRYRSRLPPFRHRLLRLRRLPPAPARERSCLRSACRDRGRARGLSGTIFIRFRAICCASFFLMTRRSSAFKISSFRTCAQCSKPG